MNNFFASNFHWITAGMDEYPTMLYSDIEALSVYIIQYSDHSKFMQIVSDNWFIHLFTNKHIYFILHLLTLNLFLYLYVWCMILLFSFINPASLSPLFFFKTIFDYPDITIFFHALFRLSNNCVDSFSYMIIPFIYWWVFIWLSLFLCSWVNSFIAPGIVLNHFQLLWHTLFLIHSI